MNHDDRDHWTSWQRNHRLPGEHRSAVYDDDPEEQDGGVVFWAMLFLCLFAVLVIVALRFGHLIWSRT